MGALLDEHITFGEAIYIYCVSQGMNGLWQVFKMVHLYRICGNIHGNIGKVGTKICLFISSFLFMVLFIFKISTIHELCVCIRNSRINQV